MRRATQRELFLVLIFVLQLGTAQSSKAQAASSQVGGQEHGQETHHPEGPAAKKQTGSEGMNSAETALMHQASGTSEDPASAPREMVSLNARGWNLMMHGVLFVTDEQQSGPRGGDKFFAASWWMGTAEHRAGKGSLLFRAMLSLDPATVSGRRYPELFQTGETAFGRPIEDGQHPHDLFMEVAVEYAHPLGGKTMLKFYAAPVGDPPLGPVAFPHRISASEIPQAPLSHHLQDSSHIAGEVFTVGLKRGIWAVEAGGFHGAEPNENRWNMDAGAVDSWAGRISVMPTENWAAQISAGRLRHPEAAEPGDIVRSTASVTYNRRLARGNWATSLIWGRNHKIAEARTINSYLLESTLRFSSKNYLAGRIELVDKDELFSNQPLLQQQLADTVGSVFRIGAYTLGYTRDFALISRLQTGVGVNFTLYSLPSAIKPHYGELPVGAMVFFRVRLKGSGAMHHMRMP